MKFSPVHTSNSPDLALYRIFHAGEIFTCSHLKFAQFGTLPAPNPNSIQLDSIRPHLQQKTQKDSGVLKGVVSHFRAMGGSAGAGAVRILPYKAFELNAHRGVLNPDQAINAARMLHNQEFLTQEKMEKLAEKFAKNTKALTLQEFRKIATHLEMNTDVHQELAYCWERIHKLQTQNDCLWQQLLEPNRERDLTDLRPISPVRAHGSLSSESYQPSHSQVGSNAHYGKVEELHELLELERQKHTEELAAVYEQLDAQSDMLRHIGEANVSRSRVSFDTPPTRSYPGSSNNAAGTSRLSRWIQSLELHTIVTESIRPLAPGGLGSLEQDHPSELTLRKHLERSGLKGLHDHIWRGILTLRRNNPTHSTIEVERRVERDPASTKVDKAIGAISAMTPSPSEFHRARASIRGETASSVSSESRWWEARGESFVRGKASPLHSAEEQFGRAHAGGSIERERVVAMQSSAEISARAREANRRLEAARERRAEVEAARHRAYTKRLEADSLRASFGRGVYA